MLGTQAVETIDMLFSAYFPLSCFSLFVLLTTALHLSGRNDLHKYQTMLLNICQANSWDLQNITISRFAFTPCWCLFCIYYFSVFLSCADAVARVSDRSCRAANVGINLLVRQMAPCAIGARQADEQRPPSVRDRAGPVSVPTWCGKQLSIGCRGIQEMKRDCDSLHSTAALNHTHTPLV